MNVWNADTYKINTILYMLTIINNMRGGEIDIFVVLIFFRAFTPFVLITFVLFKIRTFCNYQVMRRCCHSTLLYI